MDDARLQITMPRIVVNPPPAPSFVANGAVFRLQADAADGGWMTGSKSKLNSRGILKANTETIILVHGNLSVISHIEPIKIM
jgi:hypothetical protein